MIGCKSGSAIDEAIQQVAIAYLSQVGIKVSVQNYAASTWTAMMYDGEYQLGGGGYITSPGATRTVMYANPEAGGFLNRGNWINDDFTALCEQIDVEMDTEKRKELVAQALEIFDSELPQIILFNNAEVDVINSNLKGFKFNPTNMTNFCQASGWWLDE